MACIGRYYFTMSRRIQTFCRRLLELAVFGADLPIGSDSDVSHAANLFCYYFFQISFSKDDAGAPAFLGPDGIASAGTDRLDRPPQGMIP
jgi:hypothetical protein